VCIGPAAAAESYLNIEAIVEAARATDADAVHPGYGFLAERAGFAEAIDAAGLVFVGPPASAIRAMGEKTEARRRMQQAGVPVVPGTTAAVESVEEAVHVADDIGYPVLMKAVAGGGGKGMRAAETADELRRGFPLATSEALKAFGNGDMYLERLIREPRHIEIQILADRHNRTVHFGERECSVQRRHQKLIEEAPSPAVSVALRRDMGEAAVRAAESVGYVGAGTVEFLVETDGTYHFLEMNTRIQVEHPVTEMIYGVDLVREQLAIARGDRMRVPEGPIEPQGHAIECRITSEDPFNAFLPATGTIEALRPPSGPGVRWDGGIEVGTDVGLFYDPLLAKLIVWGEDRDVAVRRMRRALSELLIVGVPTSQPFHARVMREPVFCSGDYNIEYLSKIGEHLLADDASSDAREALAVACALAEHGYRDRRVPQSHRSAARDSNWVQAARRAGLR